MNEKQKRAIGLFGMILFMAMFFLCLVVLGHRIPEEVIALTGDARTHVQALRSVAGVGMLCALIAAVMSWGDWKKKDE